ncbi:MAG: class I SAM-dependent methyltransferase [Phycisphaerae bacterium]
MLWVKLEDGAYDFVFSHIALQHMEPNYAAAYIREFARLLAPGGLTLFQIPDASGECPVWGFRIIHPVMIPDCGWTGMHILTFRELLGAFGGIRTGRRSLTEPNRASRRRTTARRLR